jgi:hypothetical protein
MRQIQILDSYGICRGRGYAFGIRNYYSCLNAYFGGKAKKRSELETTDSAGLSRLTSLEFVIISTWQAVRTGVLTGLLYKLTASGSLRTLQCPCDLLGSRVEFK